MVIDITIAIILILAMAFGYRAGFVYTFLHMIGWIVAVVLAFVWAPRAKEFLLDNTGVYETIYKTVSGQLKEAVGIERLAATLPEILKSMVTSLSKAASEVATVAVSDLLIIIVSFLLVLIAVKLLLYVLVALLSKKHNNGLRGIIDGILGLFIGFVKGIFVVFVLLAVMIPVLGIFDSGLIGIVCDWLDSSYYARTLYDNNIIALIARDFLT